jgi:hypothetical protein
MRSTGLYVGPHRSSWLQDSNLQWVYAVDSRKRPDTQMHCIQLSIPPLKQSGPATCTPTHIYCAQPLTTVFTSNTWQPLRFSSFSPPYFGYRHKGHPYGLKLTRLMVCLLVIELIQPDPQYLHSPPPHLNNTGSPLIQYTTPH